MADVFEHYSFYALRAKIYLMQTGRHFFLQKYHFLASCFVPVHPRIKNISPNRKGEIVKKNRSITLYLQ
ncbi:hypothetical protein CHISP_3157 [Chitinispirillum alkaliphilum]|nr:hypothetical protein CHISP_3157 [Chitinispirillum alkaliphilum]